MLLFNQSFMLIRHNPYNLYSKPNKEFNFDNLVGETGLEGLKLN